MKSWLYLFMFFIICASVFASDANILTYRDSYRPLETLQAEIIFDNAPAEDLSNLNFDFYKSNNIGILLFLEKLNDKRYFAYFDIPDVDNGEYKFRLKNVKMIENGILRMISKEKIIEVNDINPGFKYLSNNQNVDGSFGDISETALAALALKEINNEKASLAVNYLLNNQDATGCYPKGNCNIKDTSFSLMTLSKFNQNYIKTKNWLKDSGNNFGIGTWNLRLEGNGICENINVNGVYDLNVASKQINLTCSSNIKFTLTHSYLGNSYKINEYNGNNFNYIIDDSGCYGLKYKGKCDYISTLYASWALSEINEDFPQNYLRDNKYDNRTIDHALGYFLYNDDYDKDWLLNNYLNGYWSYYSASISENPDYFASAFAANSLKNEFLFSEVKSYLTNKTSSNILDSSLILYLLFNDERNLPSVSISPGIVNKKSTFNLKIKNNKEPMNIIIESPNFTKLPGNLYLDNEVNYNIDAKESFEIIISYGNYSYTIPVIGRDKIIEDNSPILPPPRNAIKFVNKGVNLSLRNDDSLSDQISFVNNWDFELKNIRLNVTGGLKDILEFENDEFDVISSNQTLNTKIYLNKNKKPDYKYYEGYVIVKSSKNTIDAIKFIVNFEDESILIREENKSDNIFKDKECENNEDCSESETCSEDGVCVLAVNDEDKTRKEPIKEKKNLWWLWLIIIFIIGILIFLFFRRKKEVTESFDSYANKLK